MSKFIETKCGSLVNVDSISSIQKWHEEINNEIFKVDIVIINNKNQEFIYNSSMFYQSNKNKNIDDDYVYYDDFCVDSFHEIKDCINNTNHNMILKSNINSNNINRWSIKNEK